MRHPHGSTLEPAWTGASIAIPAANRGGSQGFRCCGGIGGARGASGGPIRGRAGRSDRGRAERRDQAGAGGASPVSTPTSSTALRAADVWRRCRTVYAELVDGSPRHAPDASGATGPGVAHPMAQRENEPELDPGPAHQLSQNQPWAGPRSSECAPGGRIGEPGTGDGSVGPGPGRQPRGWPGSGVRGEPSKRTTLRVGQHPIGGSLGGW